MIGTSFLERSGIEGNFIATPVALGIQAAYRIRNGAEGDPRQRISRLPMHEIGDFPCIENSGYGPRSGHGRPVARPRGRMRRFYGPWHASCFLAYQVGQAVPEQPEGIKVASDGTMRVGVHSPSQLSTQGLVLTKCRREVCRSRCFEICFVEVKYDAVR